MAIRLDEFTKGFQSSRKSRQEEQANAIDALVKQAQLEEAGYKIQPQSRGFFGRQQFGLERDPNFVGTKQLERQKLMREEEDAALARKMIFGDSSGASQSSAFVPQNIKFGGQTFSNPNYVKPMSDLDKIKLQKEQKKIEEERQAQTESEEFARTASEDALSTIEEVKKGEKYFGPLGNLPTVAAPSTLAGEYGPRKNWEVNINKLLSQKVIDVMTAMKQASKTGATGFGQLSNKELGVLQEASTALKRDLNPEDAMRYLNQIEAIHRKFLNKSQRFGQSNGGQQGQDFGSPEEADASGLPPGTVVTVQGRKYQI